jgi:hypothetical protein
VVEVMVSIGWSKAGKTDCSKVLRRRLSKAASMPFNNPCLATTHASCHTQECISVCLREVGRRTWADKDAGS